MTLRSTEFLKYVHRPEFTIEHNVSEIGSVSILMWEGENPALLGPLERANLSHWAKELTSITGSLTEVQLLRLALSKGPNRAGVSSSHLRTKTDLVSETLCFYCI
jgi:hypothetical protein